eukprot:49030-Eustigmatos_ZCMA.PRE.1
MSIYTTFTTPSVSDLPFAAHSSRICTDVFPSGLSQTCGLSLMEHSQEGPEPPRLPPTDNQIVKKCYRRPQVDTEPQAAYWS